MGLKKCDTCNFRYDYELDKPCVVYRDDCPLYKGSEDMTNEEAIKVLQGEAWINCQEKWFEALDMAIKALEQEPSGDLTSRQSAIFLGSDLKQDLPDDERIADMVMAHNEGILEYQTQLSLLPSVKPQEPKMVLYSGDGYADGYMVYDMAECPNCGYEYEDGDKDWGLPFCPNCGQSLDWESEDKE